MPAVVHRIVRFVIVFACLLSIIGAKPTVAFSSNRMPDELFNEHPNELGRIPVLMYHNIVPPDAWRDPSVDAYMYRTYDEFWGDMLWLYENDFYLIGMNELISGNIDVPAGKHPIVFTFDDSSSLHFSASMGEDGELIIDPDCAVGLMEKFYAQYPGFGRGAHFAVVPAHRFSWPEHKEDLLFDDKVQWLIDHEYEIGNHTLTHPDLTSITDEDFAYTVSGPVLWADEFMGSDHPMNATRVLTLPFGMRPQPEDNQGKVNMISWGFHYEDQPIRLIGVLELTGGSSEAPWSTDWDPLSIPRLPVQNESMEVLKQVHLSGDDSYFTSDGNIDQVTVPWPLPEAQWGKLNVEAVQNVGKQVVKYHPESGKLYVAGGPRNVGLLAARLEDS